MSQQFGGTLTFSMQVRLAVEADTHEQAVGMLKSAVDEATKQFPIEWIPEFSYQSAETWTEGGTQDGMFEHALKKEDGSILKSSKVIDY